MICPHLVTNRTRTATGRVLVLLVGDDFEVGAVDSAFAFARAEADEVVFCDQLTVKGMVEELPDRLLGVGALGQCPGYRFIAGEAVETSFAVLTDEGLETIS